MRSQSPSFRSALWAARRAVVPGVLAIGLMLSLHVGMSMRSNLERPNASGLAGFGDRTVYVVARKGLSEYRVLCHVGGGWYDDKPLERLTGEPVQLALTGMEASDQLSGEGSPHRRMVASVEDADVRVSESMVYCESRILGIPYACGYVVTSPSFRSRSVLRTGWAYAENRVANFDEYTLTIIPMRPLAGAVLLFGAMFALCLTVTAGFSRLRRSLVARSRVGRGLCPRCAYPRIPGKPICPECGHNAQAGGANWGATS